MDDYKYKFLDQRYVEKKINITNAAIEAAKCLESEGVSITPASFVKCVDVYLRVIGMCRSENAEEFPPINIITAVVAFKDHDFGESAERVELCQKLFDLINDCVDDDHKFPESDLEQIKANIPIVMKETACFCNDIMNCIYDEYDDDKTVSVIALTRTKNGDSKDHLFGMQIMYDVNLEVIDVNIESSVLVPLNDNVATGILIESFSEKNRAKISKALQTEEDTTNE